MVEAMMTTAIKSNESTLPYTVVIHLAYSILLRRPGFLHLPITAILLCWVFRSHPISKSHLQRKESRSCSSSQEWKEAEEGWIGQYCGDLGILLAVLGLTRRRWAKWTGNRKRRVYYGIPEFRRNLAHSLNSKYGMPVHTDELIEWVLDSGIKLA